MVGREVGDIFPVMDHVHGDVVFAVENFSVEDPVVAGKKLVDNVGFSVRRGEVLGIAGLMGAGRSDLLMAIFGAHAGRVSGEVKLEGSVFKSAIRRKQSSTVSVLLPRIESVLVLCWIKPSSRT